MKVILSFLFSLALAAPAVAAPTVMYRVTIANHLRAQPLSPPVFALQRHAANLFAVGHPASEGFRMLAEEGMNMPLSQELKSRSYGISSWASMNGIMAGNSGQFLLTVSPSIRYLSFAAMLGSSNDSFMAVRDAMLPARGGIKLYASAYDAGTEKNSESCAFIPGPPCGSHGARDPSVGETVQSSPAPGISGRGSLGPKFGWDDHSVEVTIERVD